MRAGLLSLTIQSHPPVGLTSPTAREIFVGPGGSDANLGTEAAPKATIGGALAVTPALTAGDTITLLAGTYAEAVAVTKGGSLVNAADPFDAANYLTIRAKVRGTALLRPASGTHALQIQQPFVALDGLDVSGPNVTYHGVAADRIVGTGADGIKGVHHVIIRYCISHENANSGIGLAFGDYYLIESNTVYGNCQIPQQGVQGSGISVYQPRVAAGDTYAGWHIIVRNNKVYGTQFTQMRNGTGGPLFAFLANSAAQSLTFAGTQGACTITGTGFPAILSGQPFTVSGLTTLTGNNGIYTATANATATSISCSKATSLSTGTGANGSIQPMPDWTDGSGIILDNWRSTQSNPGSGTPYAGSCLVENNLCYDNGGSGIRTFTTDAPAVGDILIQGNTCYRNSRHTWVGSVSWCDEFSCQRGKNIIWRNNNAVVAAAPGEATFPTGQVPATIRNRRGLGNRDLNPSDPNTGTVFDHCLTFNGTVGSTSYAESTNTGLTTVISGAANVNVLNQDPKFVDPNGQDFTLQATSPAVDAGNPATPARGAGTTDLAGNPRSKGAAPDIGAFEVQTVVVAGPQLLAWWKLDGNGQDSVGGAHLDAPVGTFTSPELGLAPLLADGGTSIGFGGGLSGQATFGQTPHLGVFAKPTFGITLRVQHDATPPAAGSAVVLVAKDTGIPEGGFAVEIKNFGGVLKLHSYLREVEGTTGDRYFDGTATGTSGLGTLAPGTAYHVAVSYDGTNARTWLNGSLLATTPITCPNGLTRNGSDIFVGAYSASTGLLNGVLDDIRWYDKAITQTEVDKELLGPPARPPVSITHDDPAVGGGAGIQPSTWPGGAIGAYQAVPANETVAATAVWWNPSRTSGTGTGTKADPYRLFSDAENAAVNTASREIRILGGAQGATRYHRIDSVITPTKSGSSGNLMKLYGEPGTTVVLCRHGDFIGALDQSWDWTTVDASRGIYERQISGATDGASSYNIVGGSSDTILTNPLLGSIEIPNGPHGQPWFMGIIWGSPTMLLNSASSGALGSSTGGGYPGPCAVWTGGGMLRIRLQPPSAAYAGTEWPTDGMMGSLIGSNGAWREPNVLNVQNAPKNFKIRLIRWDDAWSAYGSRTTSNAIFYFNGVQWWHFKGFNTDLTTTFSMWAGGAGNITFENMTRHSLQCDGMMNAAPGDITNIKCQIISKDIRHLAWREHKNGGIWFQHMRTAPIYSNDSSSVTPALTWNDCVFWGWFDFMEAGFQPWRWRFNYCAIYTIYDDGFSQDSINKAELTYNHCFIWGGHPFAGSGGTRGSSVDHFWVHHCVIDQRLPQLWNPYGAASSSWGNGAYGISLGAFYTHPNDGSPYRAQKFYNNTILWGGFGEKEIGSGPTMCIFGDRGANCPSGLQHECYNNIIVVTGSRAYTSPKTTDVQRTGGGRYGDWVGGRFCCTFSGGPQRYDYNIFYRSVPWTPYSPVFCDVQDTQGDSSPTSYTNFSDFIGSTQYNNSASMYNQGGGFGVNKGHIGPHEAHGKWLNPNFRDIAALDYRPQASGATTGSLDLSSSGWPNGSNAGYFGAIDPNGTGNDVGPRP